MNDRFLISNFPNILELKEEKADESNTREKVIIEIIKDLGWDFSSMDEVVSNYKIKNHEEIDYVILIHERPKILIEVKKIGIKLSKSINAEKLSKYKNQLKITHGDFLIITNGLTFITYIHDRKKDNIIKANNFCIDLYEEEKLDIDLIKQTLLFSYFFSKEQYINENSYNKMLEEVLFKRKMKKLYKVLNSSKVELFKSISKQSGLDINFVKNNLTSILKKYNSNLTEKYDIKYLPLKGKYSLYTKKMTKDNKEFVNWRRKQYRYFKVWSKLDKTGEIHENELDHYLDQVLDSTQSKGPFKAYNISKKGDVGILIEKSPNVYKVAPELCDSFKIFIEKMVKENQ